MYLLTFDPDFNRIWGHSAWQQSKINETLISDMAEPSCLSCRKSVHKSYLFPSNSQSKSRPPFHLLHSINQYCVMKKRGLFAMKERDLKFNKTVKFSSSVANLRNQAMLYGSLNLNLRHTLIYFVRKQNNSKIDVEVGKSVLFSTTTHFKLSSHIFIKNR